MKCALPKLGLPALLIAAWPTSLLLVNRVVEPDLRAATVTWLADAGADKVAIEQVDGQHVVLRGPTNQMNLAIEAVLRSRSSSHWVDTVEYLPTRSEPSPTTTAAPSTPATTVAPSTPEPAPVAVEPAPSEAAPSTTVASPASTSNIVARPTCPTGLPVLSGASFTASSADLTSAAKATLDQVAAVLQGAPQCRMTIAGHTDTRGNETFNKTLSLDRANAVRDYLIERGVPAEALTAEGFGETKPKVTPEETDADRATNRRIEFNQTNAGS